MKRRGLTPLRGLALGLGALLAVPGAAPAGVVHLELRDGRWALVERLDAGAREVPGPQTLDASAPALSPDGSRVAFEVQGQGIAVCPVRGGGPCRTVRPDAGSAVRPAWNPATGELVFARYLLDAGSEDSDLLATAGGLAEIVPLLVQTGNQDDPDVSPDGRWLVYSSAQTLSPYRAGVQVVRQLWVLDLEGGRARPLVPSASQDFQPDWSPSGREVAFVSDRGGELEIWAVRADGGGLRQVTAGAGSKTWPAWSPDGKEILFTWTRDGRQGLGLVGADGAGQRPFQPAGLGADVAARDADWR